MEKEKRKKKSDPREGKEDTGTKGREKNGEEWEWKYGRKGDQRRTRKKILGKIINKKEWQGNRIY